MRTSLLLQLLCLGFSISVLAFVNIDYNAWSTDKDRERCMTTIDCCDSMHPETPTDKIGSYSCEVSQLPDVVKLEYKCFDYSGDGIARMGPYDLECKEGELAWCYDGPDDIEEDPDIHFRENNKHGMCTDEEEFYETWIQKNDEVRCLSMLREWILDRFLSNVADRIWELGKGEVLAPHAGNYRRQGYGLRLQGSVTSMDDSAIRPQELTITQYMHKVGQSIPVPGKTSHSTRKRQITLEMHRNADKIQLCAFGHDPFKDGRLRDQRLSLRIVLTTPKAKLRKDEL